MSGRRASESSVASDGDSAPPTRKHRSHNRAKSSAHAGPQQQIPQPWYPPTYHPYYQPPVPLAANPLASYPYPTAPQAANSRWDGVLDLFDEEAQDRRKKGKELIPFGPMMNGPLPPWAAYPGDYVRGPPYGTWGNTGWPGSPTQPAQLPLPRLQGGEHPSRKTIKHVHHDDQQSRTRRKRHQSPHQEITLGRQVDAILTPDSGDLTVHLTMDLGEDLEHHLDELNRLSRLGNFSAARELFDEHLRHHIDNPYVLVQYADMLYNQGDFKGVTMLKDDSLYTRDGEMPDSEELRILRSNWELLQILAKSYTLENLSGVPATLEEAVAILTDMAKGGSSDRSISSIEIEILALTIRLSGHPVLNSKWSRYGSRALAAISMSLLQLYQILLRQGRIWDLHDLVVLMPTMEDIKALTHDIFGKDLIPSLQTMISDWSDSVHGYDASTTLGLLSILTHILLEPVAASEKECIEILKLCLPLAISAAENDPSNLKSRPYLRLLLAKSRFAETASRQAVESLRAHLHSSQGILFEVDIALLPIYVPSGSESPKWTPIDQPSELRNPVRLIMRSAMDLGDMKTELLARREFIRLSASPQDEFNALCDLQLSRQGDLNGYSSSLASKYLVSTTTTAKDDLAIAISRLLSRVASTDYWESSYEWILTMLLYKLEGRSPSTIQHMFKRNNTDYQNMEESLLRDISRKMPELKDWADQRQVENSARTKLRSAALRASSGSRRNVRSPARQHKSPTARRAAEQPNELLPALGSERKAERPVSFYGSKPSNGQQAQVSSPMAAAARFLSIGNGPQGNADQPREDQETPSSRHAKLQSHPHGLPPPVIKIIERHQDNDTREIEIREKLEAEYNQKLEAEKESRRERRNERMAILEGVKQEVDAIRKEAVEQAEKKARVEAEERAEQLRWERRMEEDKLEKEMAIKRAEETVAEFKAKFEAVEKMVTEEAEKKMEEAFRNREQKEIEARLKAEHEIHRRMEAERRAYEEAQAAAKLREEMQLKAEAEEQARREAEEHALAAAKKQLEEEEYRNQIQEWATEMAKKDREKQSQIHFKDALGRKFAIPFAQGQTWQGMKELIEAAFVHIDVLGGEVLAGHYDLVGPDGTIILPQTWDQIIQPGWNITMHMWPVNPPPPGPSSEPIIVPPRPPILPDEIESVHSNVSPHLRPGADGEAQVQGEENGRPARSEADDDADDDDDESVEVWPLSRRERIANAFSALKTKVFRRRRRDLGDDSSSYYYESDD